MRTIAAIGIGGTNFCYAAGSASGELLTDLRIEPTEADDLDSQIVDAVRGLQSETTEPLAAVCIACKGLVNREAGSIEKMDIKNGATLYDVDLRGALEREFDLPVYLENDCTAAALAEYYFGVGRDHATIVHVTMGTGIGAGIVDHDCLLRGETNFAGEVGGIQVGPRDGIEAFGIPGAWEAYCSGPGILQYARERLADESRETTLADRDDLTTQAVFEAAKEGDTVAEDYLDDVARYNAAGFGTICNLYNPGLITVGGGVAQNNPDRILSGISEHIDDFLIGDPPRIEVTEFGHEIGIYGALAQLEYLEVAPTDAVPTPK